MRALLSALAILVLTAGSAEAIAQCLPRDLMEKELERLWGEFPDQWGVIPNGSIVELFLAPNNGNSFSIIITHPSGRSCIMVGGYEWGKRKPPLPGEPA